MYLLQIPGREGKFLVFPLEGNSSLFSTSNDYLVQFFKNKPPFTTAQLSEEAYVPGSFS